MRLTPLFLIVFLTCCCSAFGQPAKLHLAEEEIQAIINSPVKVDAKIEELTELILQPTNLAVEVSVLQTILLLEPYSEYAHCNLGIAYSRISELLMRIGVSNDALNFIHRGLKHEELCSDYNSKRVCNMIGKLGSFHLLGGNLDSALFYFRRAERYTDTMRDPIWHSSAMNNLGMAWMAAKKYDSAYVHYNSSIFDLSDQNEAHDHLLGSITDNLAEWHENQEEYELAKQRHEENVGRFAKYHDTLHLAQSWLGIVRTEWALENILRSDEALDSAFYFLEKYSQQPSRRAEMMVEYYRLRSEVARSEGKDKLALVASDSALIWEQRHYELDKEALKAMISVLNESDLARVARERGLRKELLELKDESHKRLLIIIVISILAAVLVLAGFVKKRK